MFSDLFAVINYPVSAILWFWHQVFGAVFSPDSGYAWALSVVFLVFTLRALLFRPFMHQVRAMRKMQQAAPRIRELQAEYADDRQGLMREMQKLQAEQGFNPINGCLPILVQIPVFLGLYHVLIGFRPGAQSNYIFDAGEVASFVRADLFGAKLSLALNQPAAVLDAFGTDFSSMLLVGVPLMIIAAIATHLTARHSIANQPANQAQSSAAQPSSPAGPQAPGGLGSQQQTQMLNRMSLWIFPAFALIGGPFLPIAILIYWLANNVWTLAQQRFVYGRMDREPVTTASS